jgi:RNA-binding protein
VTEALLRSVEEAFNTRELMKIKVLQGAPEDPRQGARRLADGIAGVQVVQTIGRTVVLYRPFPEVRP